MFNLVNVIHYTFWFKNCMSNLYCFGFYSTILFNHDAYFHHIVMRKFCGVLIPIYYFVDISCHVSEIVDVVYTNRWSPLNRNHVISLGVWWSWYLYSVLMAWVANLPVARTLNWFYVLCFYNATFLMWPVRVLRCLLDSIICLMLE